MKFILIERICQKVINSVEHMFLLRNEIKIMILNSKNVLNQIILQNLWL